MRTKTWTERSLEDVSCTHVKNGKKLLIYVLNMIKHWLLQLKNLDILLLVPSDNGLENFNLQISCTKNINVYLGNIRLLKKKLL